MGVGPDEVGRFYYPEFAYFILYYSNPEQFFGGAPDEEDAMNKLATYHSIQQDIIRKAEAKKKESQS